MRSIFVKLFTKSFLALILLAAASVPAQTGAAGGASSQPPQWHTLQSDNGEFSISIPAGYRYFYDPQGFELDPPTSGRYAFAEMQMLGSFADKTIMTVEIYRVPKPKKYLDKLINHDNPNGKKTKLTLPGFSIQQFELDSVNNSALKRNIAIKCLTKYIASKDHIYVVSTASRGAEMTPAARRFLDSIVLTESPAPNANGAGEKAINISKLTPFTLELTAQDQSKIVHVKKDDDDDDEKKPAPRPAPNPNGLVLLNRPKPTFSRAARKAEIGGTIRVRATFDKRGIVSNVIFLTALPGGLSRNALFSALRMKFIPAERDGELITVSRPIEYGFFIY